MSKTTVIIVGILCLVLATEIQSLPSSQFIGMRITKTETLSPVTLRWKQGSVFLLGGNKIHNYNVYVYTFDNGANVLLFCQDNMDAPSTMNISNELQYGMQNGEIFLVLHDKSRKPFQHRFVENKNALTGWAKYANEQLKDKIHFDATWVVGDYLRDF